MQSTTVRAESVEKAIRIGLTKLNITQDEAVINVISEGKKGLFGFGKQDAIVEVSAKEIDLMSEISIDVEEDFVDEVAELTEEQVPVEVVEVIEVTTEEEDDDELNHLEEETEKAIISEHEEVASSETVNHDAVARYLEEVIRAYGADATITVEVNRHQVVFNIETEKSGLIIGKHGKIINSLQVLAQVMVHQYDRRRQSVILNIGDYRDRRANVLEQMADRTAKEVLRTKRSVVLDPLPSYERKQIHAYLSKVDHVETHSEGRDPNRYLVVEYKA